MVNDLATLGSRTLHQAASVGFERALNDLRLWGYVSTFPSPVVAPPHLSKQAIDENDRYLQKSLLPYMRGVFKKVAQPDEVVPALASIHARVKQYGHYVWRASERAFISGLRELMDARRTHMGMREGGTGSGDFAHAGRPGEVGGSAHGVDLEVPKEFDKVLHNPQFKKTFDTLLQNPDLQTEHFKGTVYHGIEDMDRKRDRHAAAVLKGKEPFYNTTQGAYGPGLYFATSEREASAYGRHMFSTELDGKLLHMNDYDYVHRFANKLDEVARSLGFSVSVFGEVANYALKGYGYDGLRISFGEKTDTVHSPDYLVDVNASKLKFGYEGPLTEAEQRGDVIVLFKAPTGEVTWLR
jgi:hypothetical protein